MDNLLDTKDIKEIVQLLDIAAKSLLEDARVMEKVSKQGGNALITADAALQIADLHKERAKNARELASLFNAADDCNIMGIDELQYKEDIESIRA